MTLVIPEGVVVLRKIHGDEGQRNYQPLPLESLPCRAIVNITQGIEFVQANRGEHPTCAFYGGFGEKPPSFGQPLPDWITIVVTSEAAAREQGLIP